MNEQILNKLYEGYVKWMKETNGYLTCCSKAEFKHVILYWCNAMIVLMGNEDNIC